MISIQDAWQKIGADCHIHLRRHVKTPAAAPKHELRPMIDAALQRNLVPYIREHAPLPKALCIGPNADYQYGMRYDEINHFFSLLEGTNILMGLEVDYVTGFEEETARIIDYFMKEAKRRGIKTSSMAGSVHILPGKTRDFSWNHNNIDLVLWELNEAVFHAYLKEKGTKGVLSEYFDALERMIQTRQFDVICHLDQIRKLDTRNDPEPSAIWGNYEDYYLARCRGIVDLAQEYNMVLEINTAGKKKKWGKIYIHQEILSYCAEKGVGVQVSSDAHLPEHAGQFFDEAYETLMRAGIEEIVLFENRKPFRKSIL